MASYTNGNNGNGVRPRSSPIAISSTVSASSSSSAIAITSASNNRRELLAAAADRDDYTDSDDDDLMIATGGGLSSLSLVGGNNRDDISYVGSVPIKPRGMIMGGLRRAAKQPSSLSSSLPAAPLLASRGINFDTSNIPPPMTLTNNDLDHHHPPPSYGSLRESHLEGKFLDGPASYRDRTSGQLHALKRHQQIRLDDSATSYQAPTMSSMMGSTSSSMRSRLVMPNHEKGMGDWSRLTPGERILAATATTPPNKHQQPTTSTLSSMFKGDDPFLPQQQQQQQASRPAPSTTTATNSSTASGQQYGLYYGNPEPDESYDANDVLSTSLTGFDILKAASQHPELLLQRPPSSLQQQSMRLPTDNMMPPSATANPGTMIDPLSPQYTHDNDDDDDDDEDDELFELDME